MTSENLELHIEELILHGFMGIDQACIGAMVEHELTRLLAEKGLPRSLTTRREIAYLNGGIFEMAPSTKPEIVGTQVAQAIYRGIRQ